MAIILYEPNVNEPEKKIEKINDLIPVFSQNEEVTEVLNEALELLQGNRPATKGLGRDCPFYFSLARLVDLAIKLHLPKTKSYSFGLIGPITSSNS